MRIGRQRSLKSRERALLVSRFSGDELQHLDSIQELARLAETAGAQVIGEIIQQQAGFDPATLIGSGKVQQIQERIQRDRIDLVVFDQELSPSQNRNLEATWDIKVLDRTGLILDIFARHAVSREGKLQVELAQLDYMLPRLVGQVAHWSRLAGGIGTLGPGETLLEVERRRLRDRIARLRKELKRVQGQRDLQRRRRQKVPVPLVLLVGYTNAGKSSLMNRLTEAGVLVEDALFATLDPTVRRVRLPSARRFLLADTVGFVRKLPHQLVEAFKTTLHEIGGASLLLHVVDTPQAQVIEQVETVERVLEELGYEDKPTIRVFNKSDLQATVPAILRNGDQGVQVSAATGAGLSALLERIETALAVGHHTVTLNIPYADGASLREIYQSCRVLSKEDHDDGVHIKAEMGPKFIGKFASFIKAV